MGQTTLFMLLADEIGTGMLDKLDPLVKLANVGAAGIAVLAVFLIGAKIFNLPNDTSKNKVLLLKQFMSMCIILTIVCGLTGIASIYFNRMKIQEADNKTEKLVQQYDDQVQRIEREKALINNELVQVRMILQNSPQINPEAIQQLDKTEFRIGEMKMAPVDQFRKLGKKAPVERPER
jgi:hypothetical protein